MSEEMESKVPAVPRAFRLAYLDFSSVALEDDLQFYTEVMGLKRADESAGGKAWLTVGSDHHNISLTSGPAQSFDSVGYQLPKGVGLAPMEKMLRSEGVKFVRKSDARPGVPDLLEIEAVGGHVVQLIEDMTTTAKGLPHDGVAPLRLGHFAVISAEGDRINKLYRDVLRFHNTDAFGDAVHFYTCNYEHHVFNIVQAPVPHRLHHVAFQLREYAAHARAADVLARDGKPILWGPTRHTAGHNIASYFHDNSKRLVELYTDMDVYLADLDAMEPRPWHEEIPMRPRKWQRGDLAYWKTTFGVELSQL